ncbi:peptide-methionine (S)-S-oxide reductase MsrA [Dasania sp. GY-MA-18]|uniref:Peptide methionine sulfoxide reductase MsrA n=1 Tax=Dasania phycosphaerae TaxID=2950436 RepID=A0A9J6RHQ9_9GAMM|nr:MULTISPECIES: peptide-methionine (S)-S-oxide reductase MsrA [Dasania]MCR8921445.1 peptide-methionine (S)-S-oxide reductase MsrA [Dasania sp. GY-MA-18]MCZ0863873.1 peptide-methionine (S)-S-oxide reductase MsrA [Dasania phycosphaerae]MCZ0867601.1 peptide-methionine (S)-S-oxide reductase MsrA [Dasania phycosphaerae]
MSIHTVLGSNIRPPFPEHCEQVLLAMGCFWGAERKCWQLPGVYTTAVGYAGGTTENPSYQEVCSGLSGHAEVVLVVYDPRQLSFDNLLKCFWEGHNPTQGMRQGNDIGSQYRSGIYVNNASLLAQAEASKQRYQQQLNKQGLPAITTEVLLMPSFYYAEDYHQQYLDKNPDGYCGLGGVGVEYC